MQAFFGQGFSRKQHIGNQVECKLERISRSLKLSGQYYTEHHKGFDIQGAPTDGGFFFECLMFSGFESGDYDHALNQFTKKIDDKLNATPWSINQRN